MENNAGGGQVFRNNLKTLEAIYGQVNIYSFNFYKKEVNSFVFKEGNLYQGEIFFKMNFLSSKYQNLFLKLICYLKLVYKYEIFWVEHFYALPSYKLTPKFIFKKIIYSQHDFLYKIKGLKDNKSKNKLYEEETTTITKCKAVIGGNKLEIDFCNEILKTKAYYLPISIEKIFISNFDNSKRVVHLGSFNTTASKLGFEHFYKTILPFVSNEINVELIGQGTCEVSSLNVKGFGFVEKLSNYLKKGTISIIPWKYDTGQRTRVFESLSYGCVIVSYSVLGKIIPELINNVNCILVETEMEFAQAINNLVLDNERRNKISEQAIITARELNDSKRVERVKEILEL